MALKSSSGTLPPLAQSAPSKPLQRVLKTKKFHAGFQAVIKIFTTFAEPNFESPWFEVESPEKATGSGVVIFWCGKKCILTAAHVIADSTFIQVQKISSPNKKVARVMAVSHECDLALLSVDDYRFFRGITPVTLGQTPHLRDKVVVCGFPVGGDEISITEGVVSRIELQEYSHSFRRLLALTIDAAINSGSSGGPVFTHQLSRVVGIAFQALVDAELVGHVVPPPIIEHFLKGVAQGHQHVGFPALGIFYQRLINPYLRKMVGIVDLPAPQSDEQGGDDSQDDPMPPKGRAGRGKRGAKGKGAKGKKGTDNTQAVVVAPAPVSSAAVAALDGDGDDDAAAAAAGDGSAPLPSASGSRSSSSEASSSSSYDDEMDIGGDVELQASGVRVTAVWHDSTCDGKIKEGDVLLEIDGRRIANNGTVEFEKLCRTDFEIIAHQKYVGDTLTLTVLRDGKVMPIPVELKPFKSLVPRDCHDLIPRFFVYGGLVFQPLTQGYLTFFDDDWQTAYPATFQLEYYAGMPTKDRTEVVFVSQVLSDRINVGYESYSFLIVEKVNDEKVKDLLDFVRKVEAVRAPDQVRIEFKPAPNAQVVFPPATEMQSDMRRIMTRYRVPKDRSDDLIPPESRPPAHLAGHHRHHMPLHPHHRRSTHKKKTKK